METAIWPVLVTLAAPEATFEGLDLDPGTDSPVVLSIIDDAKESLIAQHRDFMRAEVHSGEPSYGCDYFWSAGWEGSERWQTEHEYINVTTRRCHHRNLIHIAVDQMVSAPFRAVVLHPRVGWLM
jgi:hypothetical protein